MGLTGVIAIVLLMQVLSETSFLNKDRTKDNPIIESLPDDQSRSVDGVKDSLVVDTPTEEKINTPKTKVTFKVTLVVPSFMAKEDVYVDNELAEVVDRGLTSITVRLEKKDGSHRFEMKKGTQKCVADKLIEKDAMRFPLLCD